MRNRWIIVAAVGWCGLWTLALGPAVSAAQPEDLVAKLDRMASLGEKADPALVESVAEEIDKNPAAASQSILPQLREKNRTERQLATYVWALGLSRDSAATDAIIALHRESKSELIKENCRRTLAMIGGKPAGEFLLSALGDTRGKEQRFAIFNLLGEMQYEAALPKTVEILQQDAQELYWQSVFVFGKMGDKAVPFLIEQLDSNDRNVRVNAVNILGRWLIAPEAAKPLLRRFWAEKDAELRGLILGCLELTIADFAQEKAVFEEVVAKEQDKTLVQFARESLVSLAQAQTKAAEAVATKRPNADVFRREYDLAFKSAGKKGDMNALWLASTSADEPKLKALRERILQRDSDEAFEDYQKVNAMILRNRWIRSMPKSIASQKAADPHGSKTAESGVESVRPDAGRLAFDVFSGYFVSNQFEPNAAESFVVVADQKHFDEVFGMARVIGDQSHHLPENVFASNLVVAAVKRGKAIWEFKVESVTLHDDVVELRYGVTETKNDTASFACPLIVSIPKGDYKAIQFIENGKEVEKIETAPR